VVVAPGVGEVLERLWEVPLVGARLGEGVADRAPVGVRAGLAAVVRVGVDATVEGVPEALTGLPRSKVPPGTTCTW
jgi:hypothetical protein